MKMLNSASLWVVLVALGFAGAPVALSSAFAQEEAMETQQIEQAEASGASVDEGTLAEEGETQKPSLKNPQDPTEMIPTFDSDMSDLVPVEDGQGTGTQQVGIDGGQSGQQTPSAQQLSNLTPDQLMTEILNEELGTIYSDDVVVLPDFPSLLFLPGEHSALEAAKATFVARPVTEDEVEDALKDKGESLASTGPDLIPSIREISLGGIMFNAPDDWIIWLNKEKITPGALPDEVMGLNVHKDYIELRWFDKQTNKIFPVRLRPNQRFNLDALLFLPG